MRFFLTAFAALAASTVVSALTTPAPAPNLHLRQAVGVGVCANVQVQGVTRNDLCNISPTVRAACDATIPSVGQITIRTTINTLVTTLNALTNPLISLCLCESGGVLTADSVASLRTALNLRLAGGLLGVDNLLNTLLNGLTLQGLLSNGLLASLENSPNQCPLPPANSQPTCSNNCGFTCNTGYVACGEQCVLGTTCPSQTRRRRTLSNNFLCNEGFSACAIPGNKFGFECLDTISNVESCGGCVFPLPGGLRGVDCTSLPGVSDIACVNNACVASACDEGYSLKGTECVLGNAKVGKLLVSQNGRVVRRSTRHA